MTYWVIWKSVCVCMCETVITDKILLLHKYLLDHTLPQEPWENRNKSGKKETEEPNNGIRPCVLESSLAFHLLQPYFWSTTNYMARLMISPLLNSQVIMYQPSLLTYCTSHNTL